MTEFSKLTEANRLAIFDPVVMAATRSTRMPESGEILIFAGAGRSTTSR
jgi:hypothetical protein